MFLKKCIYAPIVGAILFAPSAFADNLPVIDWAHGARRGSIIAVYSSETPDAQLPACIAAMAPEKRAGRSFARVQYRHIRKNTSTIAEIADPMQLTWHGDVEVWPADCEAGAFAKITRQLTPVASE